MRFKAEPNLFVKINNKYVQRVTGMKGFYFDENGEYETDNELLIKVLEQNFEAVEQPKKYQCKQCDFSTDNRGELLAHYKVHKEG